MRNGAMRIAGIGDNVVDYNYTRETIYPGGNCINFAVYGRQLGCSSSYIGVVGRDREGELVLNALRAKGVDTSLCIRADGETGRCGIRLTDGDRTIVEENDKGVVKSQPLQITAELLGYLKSYDILHSSCYSCIEDQLGKIKAAGLPLVYDFSDEWTEQQFAEICPDITFAFFSGKDLSEETLTAYLKTIVEQYHCELAITTIGGRGALIYDGIRIYRKEPYNFEGGVIDTTGAGDSWITGFITTYMRMKKELEALRQDSPENYLREADIRDFYEHVIEAGMSTGNILARRNCLVQGSFGCGVSMMNDNSQ